MSETSKTDDTVGVLELLSPLARFWVWIWQGACAIALVVLFFALAYYIGQPRTWSAMVGFEVLGVSDEGHFENGEPFRIADVLSGESLAVALGSSGVDQFCAPEDLRLGLTATQDAAEMRFAELAYQATLADPRTTAEVREQASAEYVERRAKLQHRYVISAVATAECRRLPQAVVEKLLHDILDRWASAAQQSRNVLGHRSVALSTLALDALERSDAPFVVRASELRKHVERVVGELEALRGVPGTVVVRADGWSLLDIEARLGLLLDYYLDPLVLSGTATAGAGASDWLLQAYESAVLRVQELEQRAAAYRAALRDLSVASTVPFDPPTVTNPNTAPQVVQQIDTAFMDKLLEVTEPARRHRQELAEELAAELVAHADATAARDYLRVALDRGAGLGPSSELMNRRLRDLTKEVRDLVARAGALREVAVSAILVSGAGVYRTIEPVQFRSVVAFAARDLILLVLWAWLLAFVVLCFGVLARHQLRRFVTAVSTFE